MKKITLLAVAFLFAMAVQAQETSFESSEGYQLGKIDGQDNWQSSLDFFTVTDSMASDGAWSLDMAEDVNGEIPEGRIAGPIYQLGSAVSSGTYKITTDLYVTADAAQDEDGEMDFLISDIQNQSLAPIAQLTIYNGNAVIFQQGNVLANKALVTDDWNSIEVRMDFDNSVVQYLANGDLVYTDQLPNGAKYQALALFTSGSSQYFIDNIQSASDIDMGVENFDVSNFTHYIQNDQLYLSSDKQINEVEVFNLLGQQVITQNLEGTSGQIDLSNLSSGVYVTKVNVNGQAKSFKIVK